MAQPTYYTGYASSRDPSLRLYAQFAPALQPAQTVLRMHGWHGSAKTQHSDDVSASLTQAINHVNPDMRGRGDSTGKPDASGWELFDAVDAIAGFATAYPDRTDDRPPLLWGGSGGGGNVLGLLGKFPDLFAAAVCECGISDYGLWFAGDTTGEFRDELEDASWIGGSPQTNPEAYLSRGGRTTAMNLLTPLLIVHGEEDARVPFAQAEAYFAATTHHRRDHLVSRCTLAGVGNPGHFSGLSAADNQRRKALINDQLDNADLAPALPQQGTMVVAGYLETRHFGITLEHIDRVALLTYDLDADTFLLRGPTCRQATLNQSGARRQLACAPMPLDALCEALAVPNPANYVNQ